MQGSIDRLPAPVTGPVPRDAKGHLEPGSRDTQKSLVSSEPGSGDASTHARGACVDSKSGCVRVQTCNQTRSPCGSAPLTQPTKHGPVACAGLGSRRPGSLMRAWLTSEENQSDP